MINGGSNIKSITARAVITRADGTIVDLGSRQIWHRNPLIRLWRKIKRFLTERK